MNEKFQLLCSLLHCRTLKRLHQICWVCFPRRVSCNRIVTLSLPRKVKQNIKKAAEHIPEQLQMRETEWKLTVQVTKI